MSKTSKKTKQEELPLFEIETNDHLAQPLGMVGGQIEEQQILGVGQYLEYLNIVLKKTADVKILGEITSFKEYPSGIYFSLKDKEDEAVLNCFLPIYTFRGLNIPIEDGMEVRVSGMPRIVKRNGRFQLTVESMELAGEGALKKAYDFLKNKLEQEGIFSRKRDLPLFISSVGAISSKSGAVIHDFRNNLEKLGLKIFFYDSRVEGNQAIRQICQAIEFFNQKSFLKVDVIVLMRGGGSLEDLQAFNSEQVARAVYASKIPIIVAIGHDKDTPLAQLSADFAPSTPTAAAKLVSSSWEKLETELPKLQDRLLYNFQKQLLQKNIEVKQGFIKITNGLELLLGLHKRARQTLLNYANQSLSWIVTAKEIITRQKNQIASNFQNSLNSLDNYIKHSFQFVESMSPERNLKLGYSIVRNQKGEIVKNSRKIKKEEVITTRFAQGEIESKVIKIN